jgi:hypothetical protein
MPHVSSEDEFWLSSSPNSGDLAELESDGQGDVSSVMLEDPDHGEHGHSILGDLVERKDEEITTEDKVEARELHGKA